MGRYLIPRIVTAPIGRVAHVVVIFVFRLVHIPVGMPAMIAVSMVVRIVVLCCSSFDVNSASWITGGGGGGALMLKAACWNILLGHRIKR